MGGAAPRAGGARADALAVNLAHLSEADPVLARVIASVHVDALNRFPARRPADHYGALVRAIVGQQLSTKAAGSIYERLTDRYGGRTPTPAQVLADDPDELRQAAGLSRAKTTYLRSLAEHVSRGELELERLVELSDEDVIAELVAVKGIGLWSSQMFLMFQLDRPDVLPVGDLGIRRAIQRWWELEDLPDAATTERIGEPWRPLRTLASRCLWRSLANEPV